MKIQTENVIEEQNRDQRENFLSKLPFFFPARVTKIDTIHLGTYHSGSERKSSCSHLMLKNIFR